MPAARDRNFRSRLTFEQLEPRSMLAVTTAPFAVTPFHPASEDPLALVQALSGTGSGLNIVPDSVSFRGADNQAGFFSGLQFDDSASGVRLSLPDGILLTSGNATSAVGNTSTNAGSVTGTPGDSDLTKLLGLDPTGGQIETFDSNVLQFQFTTPTDAQSIALKFLFGSEEFPDFLGSRFDDVIGIFLDGQSVALDSSGQPISSNSDLIRLENTSAGQTDLVAGKIGVDLSDIQYGGLTRELVLSAALNPDLQVHTLKLAIADGGDTGRDSAWFLAGLAASNTSVVTNVHEVIEQVPPTPPGTQVFPLATSAASVIAPNSLLPTSNPNGTITAPVPARAALVSGQLPNSQLSGGVFQSGGGGGGAPAAVASSAPAMPNPSKPSDIALVAFAGRHGSGNCEEVEAALLKLADLDGPRMMSIEYGDDVVHREVAANKQVVAAPAIEKAAAEPIQTGIVGEVLSPLKTALPAAEGTILRWLWIVPAGAAAAAGWIYRHRLLGNFSTMLRRLGVSNSPHR
ncbi:MAG TPA: choice-of-anchor L domain-containing protein [Pirellulales bacterium]|jgi:hypothetical protein